MTEPNDPFAKNEHEVDPFASASLEPVPSAVAMGNAAASDPFASPAPSAEPGVFDINAIDSTGVPALDLPPRDKPLSKRADDAPAKPRRSSPRCATHPDRAARSVACERCGNYACEACFSIDNDRFCVSCADRVGMVVPWENSGEEGILRRLLHTCTHLAQAPFERFGHIADGDLGRALSFTGVISLVTYGGALLLCGPFALLAFGFIAANDRSGDAPGALLAIPIAIVFALIFPFVIAASHMLANLIWGSIYHLAAKLAGGQASYTSSLRAAQYQSILVPVDFLVSFISNVPLIGPLISLGWLAAKNVLCIFAYAGHATNQHRLQGATAWFVAAVPTLLALMLFVTAIVLMAGFIFATIGESPLLSGPSL